MNNTLTQKLKGYLREINLKKLEKIFSALFLLSIPLQTRLTINTPQTYLNGTFNEYGTFFLYLSDILFIITLLLFFVNILTFTNRFNIIKQRFHSSPHLIPIAFFLITLITWSFIDIIWASEKNIAFYQAIKLVEFALFFLYIKQRLYWFGIDRAFIMIFVSGSIESVIGISQYVLQRSLGLKVLMESVLSPDLPNVAKIIVDGTRIIRAYGTFPHPNVFSGFLILSIFCGIWLLFSYKTVKAYKIVSRETILYAFFIIGIIIQLIAFVLTFSRIAWLTLILIILIYIFLLIKSKLFHVKQFWHNNLNKIQKYSIIIIIFSLVLAISLLWKQINSRTTDTGNKYQQSIDYRIMYNDTAVRIINTKPIIGIGNGNFTLKMKDYSPIPLEWWQYQPVHNIYLLIASEMGLVGLIIFLAFIFQIIKKAYLKQKNQIVSRETILAQIDKTEVFLSQTGLIAIFTGFLFIGLFDHYFWTLQQGQLTFWLVLGVLSATENKN